MHALFPDTAKMEDAVGGLAVLDALSRDPVYMHCVFTTLIVQRKWGLSLSSLANNVMRGRVDLGFGSLTRSCDDTLLPLFTRQLASLTWLHEQGVIVNDAHVGNVMCVSDESGGMRPDHIDFSGSITLSELAVLEQA